MLKGPWIKMSKVTNSEYLKLKEVAKILKVSRRFVKGLIDKGQLTAINVSTGKINRHYRINRADIDRFLESRTVRSL